MSQLLVRDNGTAYQRKEASPTRASKESHVARALVLRATGIVLLVGLAIIHVVQLVPTFQQTPLLGGGYVLLIAGTVVVGARLVKGHESALRLWLPVAGLGMSVFIGYGFTRVFSTPLDRFDVGNWACELGMAALFVEFVLIGIALYAISLHRAVQLRPNDGRGYRQN
jgi:hypothetical protein